MKKIIITTCLLIYYCMCVAQDTATAKSATYKKMSFHSINQIGLLEGEAGTHLQLQTINGVGLNKWFAGIGTGIDYYTYRTIPLFLDIRRNFSDKRITPFVYVDGGTDFPWIARNAENAWYNSKFKNGWYYDVGVGYTIQTKSSGGFMISLGYSGKQFSEKRETPIYYYPTIYDSPSTPDIVKFDYHLRRVSIKVGWKF